MEFIRYILLVCCIGTFIACKKDKNDDGDFSYSFPGQYKTAYGAAIYSYNGPQSPRDHEGRDTASFSIIKPQSTDSTNYVYISGVVVYNELYKPNNTYFKSLRFINDGALLAASVTGNTFTINHELAVDGSLLHITGDGIIDRSGELTIRYITHFRGYSKTAVVTLKR